MLQPVIELSWAGVALVPLAIAVVQVVKIAFPSVEGRWSPAMSLVVGIGLAFMVSGVEFLGSQILGGVVVGLMASGLYSQAVTTFGASKASKEE